MVLEFLAQNEQGGSSWFGLALPVLMIVGFYFLLIRPQRNRQRAQQTLLASLEEGDEIMTTGGIFGTIIEIDEDEGTVLVEIAPGTRVRMVRNGIAQRFVEEDYDEAEGSDDEADLGP